MPVSFLIHNHREGRFLNGNNNLLLHSLPVNAVNDIPLTSLTEE